MTEDIAKENVLINFCSESIYVLFQFLKIQQIIPALITPHQGKTKFLNNLMRKQKQLNMHYNYVLPSLVIIKEGFQNYYLIQRNKQNKDLQQEQQNQLINEEMLISNEDAYDKNQEIALNNYQEKEQQQNQIMNLNDYDDEYNHKQNNNEDEEEDKDNQDKNSEYEQDEEDLIQQQVQKQEYSDLLSSNQQESTIYLQADQPFQLKTELLNYQKQALLWMSYREGIIEYKNIVQNNQVDRYRKLNSFWKELVLLDGTILYYNEYSCKITNVFQNHEEQTCKGGILADEMGLGKTLMALSLIVHNPSQYNHKDREIVTQAQDICKKRQLDNGYIRIQNNNSNMQQLIQQMSQEDLIEAGTLIIVPLSVFSQWILEIQKHFLEGSIIYYEYYDQKNRKDCQLNLYDIVITTYTILGNEYSNYYVQNEPENQKLFNYKWHRVILDEAHVIKGKGNNCSRGAYSLQAANRWCITGTPLHNKFDDLYSLIHFMRLQTFENYHWWNIHINMNPDDHEVYHLLQTIIKPIIIRRLKNSQYQDGSKIISLPEKHHQTIYVELNPIEKEIYNKFYYRSKLQFEQFIKGGNNAIKYGHIFLQLTRLRQICDHPALVFKDFQQILIKLKSKLEKSKKIIIDEESSKIREFLKKKDEDEDQSLIDSNDQFIDKQVKQIIEGSLQQDTCPICIDQFKNPILLKCGHIYCKDCINLIIKNQEQANCPNCREIFNVSQIQELTNSKDIRQTINKKIEESLKIQEKYEQPSSKQCKIIEEVIKINNLGEKVIIYSQWIDMLNILEIELNKNKIRFQRLDGKMNKKQRKQAIKTFDENPEFSVFLISLKAGAFGISLVSANNVFICDPWWNPAIEDQAIERVHRIGQKKDVYIKNFICSGTIEEKVIHFHEKKKNMQNQVLSMSEHEVKQNKLEDIKIIYDLK